ncbi:MAG: toll/interleukin-1 receptor domain-containing protein [Nanoarchaeota archaeon]
MKENKNTPKVFISYCWSSEEHEQWIIHIAERLVESGVNILLDKWDLKEGHDKFAYMESMVTDASVSKVLIFSDQKYKEKADKRSGGVGAESQIISKKIYDKVNQNKFIPIVLKFDNDGHACLPVFLSSRIYVDFSTPESINNNWEKLLRIIFERPIYKKPKIGAPPAYIFDEQTNFVSNREQLENFKSSILQNKSNYLMMARIFLEKFIENLENFRIISETNSLTDEILLSKINDILASRNELCEFFDIAIAYKNDPELFSIILDFTEECLKYNYPPENQQNYSRVFCENYSFFNHEMFIYLISFFIKYKRFEAVNKFLSHEYYIPSSLARGQNTLGLYNDVFYSFSKILEQKNSNLNPKRLSPTADLFKQRANLKKITFQEFMQTDFIFKNYRSKCCIF